MKTKPVLTELVSVSKQTGGVWFRNLSIRVILLGIIALVGALPETVFSKPQAQFRNDRILVKPKPGVSGSDLAKLDAGQGTRLLRQLPRIGNWRVLKVPNYEVVSNVLAAYQKSGLVQSAEPDYLVHPQVYPDDPHFWIGDQWNLINLGQYNGTPGADIHITNVWDVQTSASNIIIAVVDTGIRYTHEDLAPNLWRNPQENTDGYTNDLYGINLVDNGRGNGDPWDDNGHGTHVAGIIGAVGNNSVGIVGICWSAQLMALKFIDTNGNGTISDAITCIDYATAHGANVINASWGSPDFNSQALQDAIAGARAAGIIFVAAAGNSASNNDVTPFYPAGYTNLDNVIAVAATDRHDLLASWSNYGSNTVQLAAPGDPIFSCWIGSDSDYQYDWGTSMAAANVSGVCALLMAHFTNADYHQIISRIYSGVDPLPSLAGKCVTGGRLNVQNAFGGSGVLAVLPTTGFTSKVAGGGSYSPASQTYVLTNSGNATLDWSASPSQNWISLSQTNGVLIPSASTTVTIFISTNANRLPPGTNNAVISFINFTGTGDTNTSIPITLLMYTPPMLSISSSNSMAQGGGTFTINLVGDPNATYLIQTATNLLMNWTTISTNQTSSDGTLIFTDVETNGFPCRFYRAVSQP